MTLRNEWHSYDLEVIPRAASIVQREECRRAFYAGASATFAYVMKAVEPGIDSEARLVALQAEIMGITKDLRLR